MATSFKGWGSSWLNSWGPIAVDPNAMTGSAGFSLTATATATALLFGDGSSGYTFGATGVLTAIGWATGSASFSLSGSGELTTSGPIAGDMVGSASYTFSAIGILTDANAFKVPEWDTSQGVAGKNKPQKDYLAENLNREYERKSRIERANRLATEFVMMLVQTEILDGYC